MASISKETLIKVRDRLKICLDLMQDEANASAKEEVSRAIKILDDIIESEDRSAKAALVYQLIGKVIDKLPGIISAMRNLN